MLRHEVKTVHLGDNSKLEWCKVAIRLSPTHIRRLNSRGHFLSL